MANFFSKAEVTSSGRPVFLHGEVECHLLSSVDLEPEEHHHFPPLKSGLLILTTHRLLWLPSSSVNPPTSASAIPLPAISHIFSTKKSLKSMFHSPRIRFQVLVSPDGRIFDLGSGSGSSSGSSSVSVSGSGVGTGTGVGLYLSGGSVRMVGVAGILRKEQEMWESTDKSLQDAFQDLNAILFCYYYNYFLHLLKQIMGNLV